MAFKLGKWDLEADVVAVGSGLGGLAAAIVAHDAGKRAVVPVKAGRYLEVELFKGADLGEWRKKTYLSPHVPNGITHDEMFAWGGFTNIMKWDFALLGKRMTEDYRGFGPGMMAYFVKAALIDR